MGTSSALIYEAKGTTTTVPCRVIGLHDHRAEYRDQELILDGGTITQVRAADTRPELYVTAGFINCHVHLLMDAGPGPLTKWVTEVAAQPDQKAEQAIESARAMLKKGVTFACDKGPAGTCAAPVYRVIRQAMDDGVAMTNTIFSTWTFISEGGFGAPYGRTVHSQAELDYAVLEMEATGAGVIKMIPESPFQDGSAHYRFAFPGDLFRAARHAARERGWVFAVHAKGTETLDWCATVAADCVEHGVEAGAEQLQVFQDRGIYLGPTLDGLLCRLDYARDRQADKMLVATSYDWDQVCRMVTTAATLNQGQPFTHMLFSSDAGSFATPYDSLRELYLMRQLGWSPAAIFEAATINGARCLKQPNRGAVEPGMRADLIFWSSDPLELPLDEWQHLENHIAAVALNGRIV
jgi:imidazolonepropionase-like amidohydrolase